MDTNLQHSLLIMNLAGRAHRALSGQTSSGERRNLIRFFEAEFVKLKRRLEPDASGE